MRRLNHSVWLGLAVSAAGLVAAAGVAWGQSAERPPAVPLIAHDPYFSVWSMADRLTDEDTRHWTGTPQPIAGLARIDGKVYRFMGAEPREVPAMEQTSLTVTPTRSVYTFTAGGVALTVTFFAPAFPSDLDLLSRPVTYLSFEATGEGQHDVSLLIDVDPVIAVNTPDEQVTWGRGRAPGLTVLSVGSRDQQVLNRPGDNLRIDWGYFRLAVPDAAQAQFVESEEAMRQFVLAGELPDADDLDMPLMPRDHAAHLAVELPLGRVGSEPVNRHLLLAYTQEYSIEFLERKLRPYWQRNNETVQQMLGEAEAQYPALVARGQKFDADLTADLTKAGGEEYAQLAVLAFRQTVAAHELAADVDGAPMLFPKENFSNGCIATVDVIYPSAPFFLFFNPALVQALMKPVVEYAALTRWKWPFAPHDLGTYPLADGQVYGGGEKTEEDQMPVEESGNLLILADALGREEGNWDFVREYWPQFTAWAEYLRDKGLDPANQLSTDDFAGHLAHNANLSIKAIEALAAYGQMAQALDKSDAAQEYASLAHEMAAKWQTMAIDGDHYKLAFDKPGTWSQKYNLVWDQLLNLGLFPASVRQTEVAFYLNHLNEYGLPLDNRADYTKLDWEVWTATLGNQSDFAALMKPVSRWVNEGPTRVPLTDWYDTKTGIQKGFQARSVVGGVYIKALSDPELARKWRTTLIQTP
ncbi:MAG: DUF4965 domain-containing protein [Terracidiphilus sp.]